MFSEFQNEIFFCGNWKSMFLEKEFKVGIAIYKSGF